MHGKFRWLAAMWASVGVSASAQTQTYEQCLLNAAQSAVDSTSIGELRTLCDQRQQPSGEHPSEQVENAAAAAAGAEGVVEKRLALENYSHENPFVLTTHRSNYILPLVYSDAPNPAALGESARLEHIETQFQLSIKVLLLENLMKDNGQLSIAYTGHSFWQTYNRALSKPFRETVHEPELIFNLKNDWTFFGIKNSSNQLILNHQSNGLSGTTSRSWNRVMLNSLFETGNFMFSIKPWYRLPEDKKSDPLDPGGDDNPDIEDYLGHVEFQTLYQVDHDQSISLLLRNNFQSENRGALELGYTFPIGHTKLRGFVRYFNGFGESLIDYNHRNQTLGLGFLLSDWL